MMVVMTCNKNKEELIKNVNGGSKPVGENKSDLI
jgi:hypothetical protein